jgi:hypothetical protein
VARAIAGVRRALDQMSRRLTDEETDVFLSAFSDSISVNYLARIVGAPSGPETAKSRSSIGPSTTTGCLASTVRGQFVVKSELFDKGRSLLVRYRTALLSAIDAGSDTHLALATAITAESFEVAAMVQILVHDGVVEVSQQRRSGKRPIQKYRLLDSVAPTKKVIAEPVIGEPAPDLKERIALLVHTRGESFLHALGPGPLVCQDMAQKILYTAEDTELLARALAERQKVVVETITIDGRATTRYSLPKPKPVPNIPIVQPTIAVVEKVEAPTTNQAWLAWVVEKRTAAPDPLSFGQLTAMARRRFGTTPDWRSVFDGIAELPSIGGQKPFKVDLDEQLVF